MTPIRLPAPPVTLWCTYDERYGKLRAHASHEDARKEAARAPGEIRIVAYRLEER